MIKNIWRYSVDFGTYGGIVFAETIEIAREKVESKYPDKEFIVWAMSDDEWFDRDNADVWECYGI